MDGLSVKVKVAGAEETTYPLRPRTIIAFEQKFNKGFAKLLEEGRIEFIYWLGWHAMREAGVVVKPFDSGFVDTLESASLTSDPNSESTENL